MPDGRIPPLFLLVEFVIFEIMKEEDFLKKASIHCRYLNQFLSEGDVPKILETIKDLENLRQQAEKEKVE